MPAPTRKKRTDRNHLIYRLECVETGNVYVGITVMRGRSIPRTLDIRFRQHCYRANNESKGWALCEEIRNYEDWYVEALEVVRGKAEAHRRERILIKAEKATLNTH